jgi:hypothetical protein
MPTHLHPLNPRYLEFKLGLTVLITSAEYYGSLFNPELDWQRYLGVLHIFGLNMHS